MSPLAANFPLEEPMTGEGIYFSPLRLTADGVEWPVVEMTAGAAVVFHDQASAATFIRAKNLGPGWRVGRFAAAALGGWLEENQRRGTRLILVNPQAGPVTDAVMADDFLAGSRET